MRALITGVTGQDGSYLAELLVARGVQVHGTSRRDAAAGAGVTMHRVDVADAAAVDAVVAAVEPDRVFHFAAESFVGAQSALGMGMNVASTIALLESLERRRPSARFLLAGSAAQLAGASTSPQSESTPPAPTSTYGLAKQLASEAVRFFRGRGLHASVALLYNHESPRRPARFLSKKLAVAAARIARGLETSVEVGDLDAVRDWGYAPEYVDAMARMVERADAEDFVLATGVPHTPREMAAAAFAAAGLVAAEHLVVKDALKRAPSPIPLVGDASRARDRLGWRATTSMEAMMQLMVQHELAALG